MDWLVGQLPPPFSSVVAVVQQVVAAGLLSAAVVVAAQQFLSLVLLVLFVNHAPCVKGWRTQLLTSLSDCLRQARVSICGKYFENWLILFRKHLFLTASLVRVLRRFVLASTNRFRSAVFPRGKVFFLPS
jgi:hypothetical protein